MRRTNHRGLMAAVFENEDLVPEQPPAVDTPVVTPAPEAASVVEPAAAAPEAAPAEVPAVVEPVAPAPEAAPVAGAPVEAPAPAEVTEELPPLENHADSLETDLLEIAESEGAAAEQTAEFDEAVEVHEVLEETATALESAASNGGLSRDAAAALEPLLAHAYKRVGLSAISCRPALESYSGASTRVRSTTLVMEDLKEKAAELWAKIIAFVKRSIAWLRERFELLFGGANKQAARANDLLKRSSGLDTKAAPAVKTLPAERLIAQLYIGKTVKGKTAAEALRATTEAVLKSEDKFTGQLADALESKKMDSLFTLLTSYGKHANSIGQDLVPASDGHPTPPENMELRRSKELPGGKAILFVTQSKPAADVEAALAAMKATTATVGDGWPKVAPPNIKDLPTLSAGEAGDIATAVAASAKLVLGYKQWLVSVTKDKERVVKALEALQKDASADPEVAAERKGLAGLGTMIVRLSDTPVTNYASYALNTGKALLDYVELSLKQYEAAEAKA